MLSQGLVWFPKREQFSRAPAKGFWAQLISGSLGLDPWWMLTWMFIYIFFYKNQPKLCVLHLGITKSFVINGFCSLCCLRDYNWHLVVYFSQIFSIIQLQLTMNFGYFCTKEKHFPMFINPLLLHLRALWCSTLTSRNAMELFRKFKTFSLAVNHAAFDFVKQGLYWCWLRFMNDEVEDHLLSEAHNVALNKRLNKEEKAVWISDMLLIRSSNSRLRGCRSHDNDRCWMWDNNAHVAPHSVTFSHVENLSE